MKRLLPVILLLLLAVGAWAQQISEQQARDRALQFLANSATAKARGMVVANKQTTTAKVGAKSIYAFNLDGGGFVIASGDSRTLPVLGYSATGTIDWDNMPDNMQAWLKQYDEAIATLGDTKEFVDGVSTLRAKTRGDRPAIKPLLKTHWDQLTPYWDKVPLYKGANPNWQGQKSPTGCAMAKAVEFYNNERPHMSLNNMTPRQAASCKGKIQKKWISYREKYLENLEIQEGACTFAPQTLNMIERLSAEPVQQKQGLRENDSTSARDKD